jgi:hypothetical protein
MPTRWSSAVAILRRRLEREAEERRWLREAAEHDAARRDTEGETGGTLFVADSRSRMRNRVADACVDHSPPPSP